MRKFLVFIIAILALGLLSGCGGSQDKKEAKDSAKVLRAGATFQSYPNSYVDNGKLTGYDVEVFETVAQRLGYKVEWTKLDFAGLIGQLDSQKLDAVANDVSVTAARKEKYYFSEPYSYTGTQFVVLKTRDDLKSIENLYGKTTAAVAGSNHLKTVKNAFPNDKIKVRAYETRDGALNDLRNGRVDAFVNSRSGLIALIKKGNLPFKLVGDPINPRPSAYPFNKNNPKGKELAEAFTKEIQKLAADGTLKKISEKYYGVDVSAKPSNLGK